MQTTHLLLLAGVCASPLAWRADKCSGASANTVLSEKTIVETAVAAGSFKTLAAALQAASLVETLSGPGPFTVFAPTDAAFAALPKGTLDSLLDPKNKATLQALLTYHVVPGRVSAADVVKLSGAMTVNGQRVNVRVSDSGVSIDGAMVVKTDIHCSNGVIHVLDAVIQPSTKNLVATAVDAGSFKTLAAALKAAELVEALSGKGPFTVFAPTDEAFSKLPAGTVENLLKPENKDKLAAILSYHVTPGRVYSDAAAQGANVKSLQGQELKTRGQDGKVMVNGARVVQADIDATNGVIHVIDSVLIPD